MSVYAGPNIIDSGLVIALDAGNTKSYPGSGTTMTDLATPTRTVTIVGSPAFTSPYFTMDADAKYISMSNSDLSHRTNDFTYSLWVKFAGVDSLDTLIENGSWSDTLLFRCQSNTLVVYAEGVYYGAFDWVRSTGVWYNVFMLIEF